VDVSLSGVYSVRLFYGVINNGGVIPIRTPVCVEVDHSPTYLLLVSNNKTLTIDNLNKHRHVEDKTCVFCSE
jgi:hypothetical protein